MNNFSIGLKPVDNIRIYGLFLQLLGTGIIIFSFAGKLFLFKGHGYKKLIKNYFQKFPKRKNSMIGSLSGTFFGSSTLTGELRGIKKPANDFKDFLRYVDEEFQYIHKRIAGLKNDLNIEKNSLKHSIELLSNSVKKDIEIVNEMLSKSNISTIFLDTFGIICIFCGTIYSTIPDMIEKYI